MSRHRRPARRLPLIARTETLFVIWFVAIALSVAGAATLTPQWKADQTVAAIPAGPAVVDCGAPVGHMRVCDGAELDSSRVDWTGGRDAALGS